MSWKGNQFAIDTSNSARCNRLLERHGADEQSCSSSVHSKNVAVILLVTGYDHRLALNFVLEPLCKHGADWAVDQT